MISNGVAKTILKDDSGIPGITQNISDFAISGNLNLLRVGPTGKTEYNDRVIKGSKRTDCKLGRDKVFSNEVGLFITGTVYDNRIIVNTRAGDKPCPGDAIVTADNRE
jgi:hypothetical protein